MVEARSVRREMGEQELSMRRKWLILVLALLLPVGAVAAVGSGIDLPAWLSKRINDIRASVAPQPLGADTLQNKAATRLAEGKSPAGGNASAEDQSPDTETAASKSPRASEGETQTAALSRPAARQAEAPSAPAEGRPTIDIARLDPQGSSIIAGLATPGADVTILADGKPIAVVKADGNGEWVLITPHRFASADPSLEARVGAMELPSDVLAALPGSSGVTAPASGKVQRTAAAATRTMMSQLERLADNATTEAAAAGARQGANAVASGGGPLTSASGGQTGFGAGSTRVARRALSTAIADTAASAGSLTGLPVPVQFVYRKADFTPEGEEAAALLLRFFKLKGFKKVVLSGHADERGSETANMQLSKARLDRIARYLRDGGFEGELELVPKGEAEKYTGVDRSKYPIEELWQLDRRVEVTSYN
jgi:outer membrane protein OmpA-like peptidoglycan-associated protein